jgi:hypothetical protein
VDEGRVELGLHASLRLEPAGASGHARSVSHHSLLFANVPDSVSQLW